MKNQGEYRIDIKVRNNLILKEIEKNSNSIPDFCKKNDISYTILLDIISMKISPLHKDGRWKSTILKLSDALGIMPEDLFTGSQMHTILLNNKRTLEIKEAEIKFMLGRKDDNTPYIEISNDHLNKKLYNILKNLSPREIKVLSMRFGLADGNEKTLEETGLFINCSKERVRQIQEKALRKLRRPCINKDELFDLMEDQ